MSYIGSNSIGKLFLGTTEIAKAYLGTQLVYQSGPGPTPPEPPSGYVTDGLVIHFDGKYGATTEKWTDLINGLELVNNRATLLNDGGYSFNGTGYLSASSVTQYTGTNLTVEVVFKGASNMPSKCFIMADGSNTSGRFVLFRNSSAWTFLQRQRTYTYSMPSATKVSMSLSLDRGFANGVALSSGTADNWSNTSKFTVGYSTASSRFLKGDVYAIRLYSRRLTEEEVMTNLRVDNERFGLNLTL